MKQELNVTIQEKDKIVLENDNFLVSLFIENNDTNKETYATLFNKLDKMEQILTVDHIDRYGIRFTNNGKDLEVFFHYDGQPHAAPFDLSNGIIIK